MSAVEIRQPAADADADASSPGRRLAAARAAQNLSAADVARQLKLSVSQVEALESGLYQQLPGPIFVRGFIRNYARLVKLDPGELVLALGDSVPPSAPRVETPPSPDIPFPAKGGPRWILIAVPVALLVALLAVYEFFWNEPEGPTASPAPAAAPQPPQAMQKPDAPVAEPAISVATPGTTKPETAAQVSATVAEPAAGKSPRRGEKELKLAFNQECWVEIRDRNEKVLFSQLNSPGTQQAVSGVPPFSIVVGNAHGVRLTYDDKPVDLAPHTKIDVARLILP
jgi:cytoskeleton protein RodZ